MNVNKNKKRARGRADPKKRAMILALPSNYSWDENQHNFVQKNTQVQQKITSFSHVFYRAVMFEKNEKNVPTISHYCLSKSKESNQLKYWYVYVNVCWGKIFPAGKFSLVENAIWKYRVIF